jgi:hypothetical protein
MELSEDLPLFFALLLAVATAVMSSSPTAAQEAASFLTEALEPQAADLGDDPGYLPGTAAATAAWLAPPNRGPRVP